MRRILLPVDGSEHSIKVARYAMDMASKMGANVDLVHILPSSNFIYGYFEGGVIANADQLEKEMEEKGREVLDSTAERTRTRNVDVYPRLRKGSASQKILEMAESGRYEMIIMGSRGLKGWIGRLLGTVSRRILRNAPCPVLVVHD